MFPSHSIPLFYAYANKLFGESQALFVILLATSKRYLVLFYRIHASGLFPYSSYSLFCTGYFSNYAILRFLYNEILDAIMGDPGGSLHSA